MDHDTQMGGSDGRFPLTRHSIIEAVRGNDAQARERALEIMIAAYWKPIYKHVRMKWGASNEEAKDLTQGFLVLAMEKQFVERYAAQRAGFRTYLRLCVDGFVANQRKAASRQKRGGDRRRVGLDFDAANVEFQPSLAANMDEEAHYDRECLRSLFEIAAARLQVECEASGKEIPFRLFERYDFASTSSKERPTYEELAVEFQLPLTQVTNHLAWARRRFRRTVVDALREVTGNDEEFREEARRLLGLDI